MAGSRALRPGSRVPVNVLVQGPRGTRGRRSAIALTVRFGGSPDASPADIAALGSTPLPRLDEATGMDLLTRTAAASGAPPSFLLPASPRPKAPAATPRVTPAGPFDPGVPTAPGPAPTPTPTPSLQTQTATLDTCNQPIPGNPVAVSVDGHLTPARAGINVALRYTATAGAAPPAGTTVDHTVTTNAAGAFTDTFDRQASAWSVVASVAADDIYMAASSGACTVPVP